MKHLLPISPILATPVAIMALVEPTTVFCSLTWRLTSQWLASGWANLVTRNTILWVRSQLCRKPARRSGTMDRKLKKPATNSSCSKIMLSPGSIASASNFQCNKTTADTTCNSIRRCTRSGSSRIKLRASGSARSLEGMSPTSSA